MFYPHLLPDLNQMRFYFCVVLGNTTVFPLRITVVCGEVRAIPREWEFGQEM